MGKLPSCPECGSKYTYEDGNVLTCPECFHEWTATNLEVKQVEEAVIKDAYGNVLSDGDSVTVIKELKLKGTSSIKRGTIVKNIRLIHDPSDGVHDIDCKIEGLGAMLLKSSVVKKI